MNFNKVILAGRLTRKPEVRFTPGGLAIVKVGLAINRKYKVGDEWKEEAVFVDVTIFGKRGEAFAQHHDKGAEAFIEGELRLDQWQDKNSGEKRSKLYVVGNEWQFVSGKRDDGGQASGQATPASALPDDDAFAPF
jgi:single-strand DNA-binding protein